MADSRLTATLVSYTPGNLQTGPVLGDVGLNYINIWAQLLNTGMVFTVEYWPYGSGPPGTQVQSNPVAGSAQNSGIVKLTGLSPGTRYGYKLIVNSVEYGPWDFVTVPNNDDSNMKLYFFSDFHNQVVENSAAIFIPTLNEREQNPTLFRASFCFGDMVEFFNENFDPFNRETTFDAPLSMDYSYTKIIVRDPLPVGFFVTIATNYYAHFVRYIPFYNIWDDWDFLYDNSWSGSYPFGGRDFIREKFLQTWSYPTFDSDNGGGINFYKKFNKTLIFVFDGRWNKANGPQSAWPPPIPAGQVYTGIYKNFLGLDCLGRQQLDWFKRIVKENENDTDHLILVNGTTFTDNTIAVPEFQEAPIDGQRDGFGIFYKHERNEILTWLDESTKFKDVLIFTGDDHRMMHWEFNQVDAREDLNVFDPANYPATLSQNDQNAMYYKWHTFHKLLCHEFKCSLGGLGALLGYHSRVRAPVPPPIPPKIADIVPWKVPGLYANKFLRYNQAAYGLHEVVITGRPTAFLELSVYHTETGGSMNEIEVKYKKEIKAIPTVEDAVTVTTSYIETDGFYPHIFHNDDFEDGDISDYNFNVQSTVVNIPTGITGAEGLKCLRVQAIGGFGGGGTDGQLQKNVVVAQPSKLAWRALVYAIGSPYNLTRIQLIDPDSLVTNILTLAVPLGLFVEYIGTVNITKLGTWKVVFFAAAPLTLGSTYLYVDTFESELISPYTGYTDV